MERMVGSESCVHTGFSGFAEKKITCTEFASLNEKVKYIFFDKNIFLQLEDGQNVLHPGYMEM